MNEQMITNALLRSLAGQSITGQSITAAERQIYHDLLEIQGIRRRYISVVLAIRGSTTYFLAMPTPRRLISAVRPRDMSASRAAAATTSPYVKSGRFSDVTVSRLVRDTAHHSTLKRWSISCSETERHCACRVVYHLNSHLIDATDISPLRSRPRPA